MIIKESVTVYQCEFCKKKLFVKQAMVKHEQWCYQNPDNKRACMNCSYLEGYKEEMIIGSNDYADIKREFTKFRCNKLDKVLYHFTVEKKGLLDKFPETFEDEEPMPKVCEHQKTGYISGW